MSVRSEYEKRKRARELTGSTASEFKAATVNSAVQPANYVAVGTGFNTVVDGSSNPWQLIVPANSGAAEIYVLGGLAFNYVTGTSTAQRVLIARIIDDLNVEVCRCPIRDYGTGTTQTKQQSGTLAGEVPNSSSDRTYRVEYSDNLNGTSGASSTLVAGGSFPNKTLRVRRV